MMQSGRKQNSICHLSIMDGNGRGAGGSSEANESSLDPPLYNLTVTVTVRSLHPQQSATKTSKNYQGMGYFFAPINDSSVQSISAL